MSKHISLLTIMICFVLISNLVLAMTPQLRFPEWNKKSIKITDWDPVNGILTVTVVVEANRIPLEKVYSQPYLQSNFNKLLGKYEKDNIKQGDKAVFVHKLNVKSNSSNWLEMDVRAKPDITGLKVLIRTAHSDNKVLGEVLEREADQIKAPIFIGTSMPILARDDIAMSVTPEIAFSPDFKYKDVNYYIWMPLDCAESQTTNSAIKIFRQAISEKNIKNIEAAGQNLINRFDTEKRTIVFKRVDGDKFSIPTKVAVEMLTADVICLKAILNQNTDDLENSYKEMKPCYAKAFVAYNLYALFKFMNNNEKAEKYKKEALAEQPAWPMLIGSK